MSQQEFDQADEQVIGMVEGHAHPDAKKAAAKICKGEQKTPEIATPVCGLVRNDKAEGCGMCADTKAAELRRGILLTTIQVLSCILVAALFVAALMDSTIVMFLVNAGVLVCGMVAAVKIDRAIRAWRNR